jgi:hypothetical protein
MERITFVPSGLVKSTMWMSCGLASITQLKQR